MLSSRFIPNVGVAGLVFFAIALATRAGMIPADALPLPNRVATAEVVVVGKVTAFEDKTVMAAPFPGAKNKIEFTIAVITVGESLLAPKGTTAIRLGFVPSPPGVRISPPPFEATVGMEGCFFLTKHGEGDFHVVSGQLGFVSKKSDQFEKSLALVKRCIKILDDPNAALKAKNAEDRFLAAGMLLAQYRTRKSANAATEAIDAGQSKLILQALAAADWTPTTDYTQLSPRLVLGRLPLSAKDNWAPPKDAKVYGAYAQQWLTDNAGTYRIERFVAEKKK
jgi:hypothetical protein